MKKTGKIEILPLTLKEHRNILKNLNNFWLSKTGYMRPLHHPLFSLIFTNFSFVLKLNGEIISYVYAAGNTKKVFIHIIATNPLFYKQGYARKLISRVEEAARNMKIKSLWCYIVEDNQASMKFFISNGFIMRKQIKINSDEIRILLRKQLNELL